jgi:hypothetical protein
VFLALKHLVNSKKIANFAQILKAPLGDASAKLLSDSVIA